MHTHLLQNSTITFHSIILNISFRYIFNKIPNSAKNRKRDISEAVMVCVLEEKQQRSPLLLHGPLC